MDKSKATQPTARPADQTYADESARYRQSTRSTTLVFFPVAIEMQEQSSFVSL